MFGNPVNSTLFRKGVDYFPENVSAICSDLSFDYSSRYLWNSVRGAANYHFYIALDLGVPLNIYHGLCEAKKVENHCSRWRNHLFLTWFGFALMWPVDREIRVWSSRCRSWTSRPRSGGRGWKKHLIFNVIKVNVISRSLSYFKSIIY